MSKSLRSAASDDSITILLVDDIPETRENIKKLLAFESDFRVLGAAGNGHEGVELAKELKPDIVIMDINMPDMDGIQATTMISEAVPTAAVIMMSAHGDSDYMRRAMLAGARNFLTKPPDPEELYNTIRTVHEGHKRIAAQLLRGSSPDQPKRIEGVGDREGNIVVVYSPKGGVGCTTIATNLASGLMKEDVRVLLVDADLQFGDVTLFLNLQGQSSLSDLVKNVDDLDVELFENVLLNHDSGLRVLMGPPRPEYAEDVLARPGAPSEILEKIANNYDFVVVDTSHRLDDVVLSLFDVATKIVLVATPTLASLKNMRFVLDLFEKIEYPEDKIMLLLNRTVDARQRKHGIIPTEKIEQYLRFPVVAEIPLVDEQIILNAITRGVPVVGMERDHGKSPTRELLEFSEYVYTILMGDKGEDGLDSEESSRKRGGLRLRLGR